MDQHNIDRLFREKLDGLEAAPSGNSWSQVEKQLKPKRKPYFYLVAAAVTLLVITWVVVPNQTSLDNRNPQVVITHPPSMLFDSFEIPKAATLEDKKEKKIYDSSPRAFDQNQVAVTKKAPTNPKKIEEIVVPYAVETIDAVANAMEVPMLEEMQIEPIISEISEEASINSVKITYIASNNESVISEIDNNPDSTSKLKKFIAFAEKIDPGEMLAGMKTAKDNLLNGGFKNKKDKSVMNP